MEKGCPPNCRAWLPAAEVPAPAADQYRHRLLGVALLRVGDVLEHPFNPKIHPDTQTAPLAGALRELGKLDILRAYYSQRTGGLTFWDGHGRRNLQPEEEWYVAVYDLTDAEADLALASYDPLAALAETDAALSAALYEMLEAGDADLQAFLETVQQNLPPVGEATPPVDFPVFDEDLPTEHECPRCKYRWSGGAGNSAVL